MLVQLEGEEEPVEVSPDQVEMEDDDPYLTQEEVDDIVSERVNRERRSTRDELKSDQEFLREAMQDTFGVEIREDGKPKGAPQDDEVEELRKKASKVDQLEDQLSEYEEKIQETRETRLENKVLQSADGIHDGAQEDVVMNAKRKMTYDEDYGWVATDQDGNVRYEGGEPVGAETVVSEVRENKSYLFKDSEMDDGPDAEPSDEPSGGNGFSDLSKDERAARLNDTGPSYG